MKIIQGVSMRDFKAFKVDCEQAQISNKEYFIFNNRMFLTRFAINLIRQYEKE